MPAWDDLKTWVAAMLARPRPKAYNSNDKGCTCNRFWVKLSNWIETCVPSAGYTAAHLCALWATQHIKISAYICKQLHTCQQCKTTTVL